MANKKPYQDLLNSVKQSAEDKGLFENIRSKFKVWVNNVTRLNASNMNDLVNFIKSYSKEASSNVEESISEDIENFIDLNAGWKTSPDDADGNVAGGEVFNDYVNNTASGQFSSAKGTNTTASGKSSQASGNGTIASGENSFAAGENTQATAKNQFVVGANNDAKTDDVFEVGIGTPTVKKNGFAVQNAGTATLGVTDLAGEYLQYDDSNDDNNSVTPRGYVDRSLMEVDDKFTAEVEFIKKNFDEWLGDLKLQESDSTAWEERMANIASDGYQAFQQRLTNWVKVQQNRSPRKGDRISVFPYSSIPNFSQTSSTPPYPELWYFNASKWIFFTSLSYLRNAAVGVKGLVSPGAHINVQNGVISVSEATDTDFGVVRKNDIKPRWRIYTS